MERQDLNQGQKLQVILCGPLEKTERALLRRGDVEIKRGSNLNLMGEIVNEICDCDMIIVLAPELTAPEDVKAYLRGLPYRDPQEGPPELVVVALPGVDGLNTTDQIRKVYPKTGLIWCCDLDFALQAYDFHADYFFFLKKASREKLEEGLTRWGERTKHFMDRGSKQ